jgi:hypothetical protein
MTAEDTFHNDITINSGTFGWAKANGQAGVTTPQFISGSGYDAAFGGLNDLRPGQFVSSYVIFEVPSVPVVVGLVSSDGTPEVLIDPSNMTKATICGDTATTC